MSIKGWLLLTAAFAVGTVVSVLYAPPALNWIWCVPACFSMFSIAITGGKIADRIDEQNR